MSSVPHLEIPGLENPKVIGRGGFGTVFQVSEPEFGRSVAVKVLAEQLGQDDVRRAFLRECQAMGALSGHPHIVSVLRGGTTDDGRPYIVMDLMTEGSLGDRLTRDGPLPWPEVLEIGVLVAGALETAHRAGILHLDLKPANLLVSRYGEPKLADFGISRLPGVTETTDGRVKASLAFAAPERLLDGTATTAADLYGLGATLFTLLHGHPAFVSDSGDDLMATVGRVVREPVPDLRRRGVPDALATVVERLMAKTPAERYASAADVAGELQAAQRATGQPVTRPVIEGDRPAEGVTVVAPRSVPGVPPLRPLVPGYDGERPKAPSWLTGSAARPAAAAAPVPPAQPTRPVGGMPAPHWSGQYPPGGGQYPPHPGPPPAPSSGRRTALVLAAVAAVAAVAVVATAVYLNSLGPNGPGGGGTQPTASPGTGTSRTTVPDPTTEPDPTTDTDVPSGDYTVVVDPGVTGTDLAEIQATVQGYISGINEGRYADSFSFFHPDSDTVRGGLDAWTTGQESSYIESPRIIGLTEYGDLTADAEITFRSYQDPEFGPNGESCTDWWLLYRMDANTGSWLIQRSSAVEEPVAC